jgi:hypothetical protein
VTEQFWCPIKHARGIAGAHKRYAGYLEYGEAGEYYRRLEAFRKELREAKKPD